MLSSTTKSLIKNGLFDDQNYTQQKIIFIMRRENTKHENKKNVKNMNYLLMY